MFNLVLSLNVFSPRKLVEGEDLRLSGMMETLSLMGMSSIGPALSYGGGHPGSAGGTAGRNNGGGHKRDGGTGAGSGMSDSMGAGGAPGRSFGGGTMNVGGLDKKKGPASGGAADAGGGLGAGGISSSTESSHGGLAVGAGVGSGAEGKGIGDVGGAIGSYVASGRPGTNGGDDSVGSALGNGTAGGSGQSQRGSGVNGGGYVGALSHAGGAETVGGRMDDTKGSECVSSGSSIDAYGDQAVEVTERRTVLIR